MTLILLAFAFAIGYASGYLDGRRRGALRELDKLNRCIRDGGVRQCPSCSDTVDFTRAILTDAILAERGKE
jgi:hypothetical protein